jgi:hypothetical protein
MARGFVYLAAVMDWFSRKVLAWRLSITMDWAFCIEALEEALARHGKPCISARCAASSGQYRSREPVHQRGVHRRWRRVYMGARGDLTACEGERSASGGGAVLCPPMPGGIALRIGMHLCRNGGTASVMVSVAPPWTAFRLAR